MADDFIQEMNEEQRILRLKAIAARVGVVVAVILLLGGIGGGVLGWQKHELHVAQQEASDRYFEALRLLGGQGQPVGSPEARQKAADIFSDLSSRGPKRLRDYAAMYLAELKRQGHDTSSAVTLWQRVVEDTEADKSIRDMAQYLVLNARADTAPTDELRHGYQALVQEGGSWSSLAKEGLAALDMREGATSAQHDEARRLLTQIRVSPNSSEALRDRAGMLLQTLGDAG